LSYRRYCARRAATSCFFARGKLRGRAAGKRDRAHRTPRQKTRPSDLFKKSRGPDGNIGQ
jgi:hypothetical protein